MKSLSHCNIKLEIFMRHAREIWGRDPSRVRAWAVEDRRFREFFGCVAVVLLSLWMRLAITSQVPYAGKPKHLLWTLLFMKVYSKENVIYALIKVKDPKTFRGRVKDFISAIADLEADIVSNPFFFVSYLCTST